MIQPSQFRKPLKGFITNKLKHFSNKFQVSGDLKNDYSKIGSTAEVIHKFSQEDVIGFANLCGDDNPIHTDPEFAKSTMFKETIVHGIFVSSLFSTIFGKSITGSIYVSQDIKFKVGVLIILSYLIK